MLPPSPRHMRQKFTAYFLWGANPDGLAFGDPVARTPIDVSRNISFFLIYPVVYIDEYRGRKRRMWQAYFFGKPLLARVLLQEKSAVVQHGFWHRQSVCFKICCQKYFSRTVNLEDELNIFPESCLLVSTLISTSWSK